MKMDTIIIAVIVPVIIVAILIGVIAFFVIRSRRGSGITFAEVYETLKTSTVDKFSTMVSTKIESLKVIEPTSSPSIRNNNETSNMMEQHYTPSKVEGDYPKQSTSVLMGFSSTKDELPLIADYRQLEEISSGNFVYGAPLSCCSKIGKVPLVVEECVRYLEENGLKEEGMLRLAGRSSETKLIKETFDRGEIPNFTHYNDINSIADALKMYLRMLPQKPLLMTKGIKETSLMTDKKQMVTIMTDELNQIPEVNYFTLKRFFGFMRTVANNATFTLMSPENIAIIFHPTLQIPQNIISLLITHPQVWIK